MSMNTDSDANGQVPPAFGDMDATHFYAFYTLKLVNKAYAFFGSEEDSDDTLMFLSPKIKECNNVDLAMIRIILTYRELSSNNAVSPMQLLACLCGHPDPLRFGYKDRRTRPTEPSEPEVGTPLRQIWDEGHLQEVSKILAPVPTPDWPSFERVEEFFKDFSKDKWHMLSHQVDSDEIEERTTATHYVQISVALWC